MSQLVTEVLSARAAGTLQRAADLLRRGGLVAFPTDTVYGLGTLPWSSEAVISLYRAKNRPPDRFIPLLVADQDALSQVARTNACSRVLAARFWPGALTLVLPKTARVPDVVSALPTVAVRMPDLALTRELLAAVGGVLAVSSANISGQPNPLTAQEVLEHLGGRIDLILDGGPCLRGVPSTLVDCTARPPAILRHGAIPEEEIRNALRHTR